jgi:hypothetical protein
MRKLELGSMIHTALRHSLAQQEKLVRNKRAAALLPVIQKLAKFSAELEEWYSGRFHLKEFHRFVLWIETFFRPYTGGGRWSHA